MTFKCDLDLQPTWTNTSNGTSPPRGQQLCKIILKSMHNCTSYAPDKLNYDHFDLYLTPLTLTFNLPEQMFQMALLLLEDNNCAKLFWNPWINVQVMAWTSSIYDHFDLYLTPLTLTFNLPKKCFKWHFSSSRTTTVQNYFWNPCINVQVMAWTSSIYDHFDLYLTPVTLTFNLPEKKWHFFSLRTPTVQNYFWNPCINVQVMAQTSSIYDHFDLYLTPVTLTFNLPEKMFQMALLLLKDNNCAKLFLKFMHKCTSYGLDKLNIWPFWPLFDPCDLDLQPT